MAETAKAKLTGKMLGVLFIFGFVNAIMYTFPYVRYVFYEQQIIAMGIHGIQTAGEL